MVIVSDAYRAAIDVPGERQQTLSITLTDQSGKRYTLGDEDIVAGSLKIVYGVLSGQDFGPGGVRASDLEISIINTDGRWDDVPLNGGEIAPRAGLVLPDGRVEYVAMGYFIVDGAPHVIKTPSQPYNSIKITAMDRMVLLDRPLDDVPVAYPVSLGNLALAICAHCGIPYAPTNFLHYTYLVDKPDGAMSCRDAMSCIAEIAGCFARCTRDGWLEFAWFPYIKEAVDVWDGGSFKPWTVGDPVDGGTFNPWTSGDLISGGGFLEGQASYSLGPLGRFDFFADDLPSYITGVALVSGDNNGSGVMVGTDTYCLQLDNPLIQHDVGSVLTGILSRVEGFGFIPFRSSRRDDPTLEAGDVVRHLDVGGKTYVTFTTQYTYIYGGKCTLEATGTNSVSGGYGSQSRRQYARLARKLLEAQGDIDYMQDAVEMASKLMAAAVGGHFVVGEGQYEGQVFIADTPDINTANKLWRWNINGFAYYANGINGGISNTAITADGSIIANIITANMIRSGILQSLNGASWIDMDTGSFALGNGRLRLTPDGRVYLTGALVSNLVQLYIGGAEGVNDSLLLQDGSFNTLSVYHAYEPTTRADQVIITSQGQTNAHGTNRKGISIGPDTIMMFGDHGNRPCGVSVDTRSGVVQVFGGLRTEGISSTTNIAAELALITQGLLLVEGGGTIRGGCTVSGGLRVDGVAVTSDRQRKQGIKQVKPAALNAVKGMRFYRYQLREDADTDEREVPIGIMADEAPPDILSPSGDSIDLYQYCNLLARSVQELTARVEKLERSKDNG